MSELPNHVHELCVLHFDSVPGLRCEFRHDLWKLYLQQRLHPRLSKQLRRLFVSDVWLCLLHFFYHMYSLQHCQRLCV